jgi:hypothetical protein
MRDFVPEIINQLQNNNGAAMPFSKVSVWFCFGSGKKGQLEKFSCPDPWQLKHR